MPIPSPTAGAATPGQDDPMILFNRVDKWYGDYHALTDISAEVRKGEVVVRT